MILTLIVLVMVAALTYVWVIRGFFSALIHLVCVIAAGAIAFGMWEPLSTFLLNRVAPDRGVVLIGNLVGEAAWGIGLVLPFGVALALLRMAVDSMLPANAQCHPAADYIGGGLCGFFSAVISTGILVLGLGFLRFEPALGGYQPLVYTTQASRGSLERTSDRFIPWVDRLTARFYTHLSLTTLRTSQPLARWHPDLDLYAGAMRLTYNDGSRNTLKSKAFTLRATYTVGNTEQPGPMTELLSDHWNDVPQRISDLNGNPIQRGHLAGYIVSFNSFARERHGETIIGNGQVRLVCESEDGQDYKALHPIAAVTRVADPANIAYARFRFDSDGTFFSSVGAAAETIVGLEFPIPAGYRPLALYVKGVRVDVRDRPPTDEYATPRERDRAIRAGEMREMVDVGPIEGAVPIQQTQQTRAPVRTDNQLGFQIRKGQEGRRMRVVEAAGGRPGWSIEEGENQYTFEQTDRWGDPFNLLITNFSVAPDTTMIQVELSPDARPDEFMRALDLADRSAAPLLIDSDGETYQAVGFIFADRPRRLRHVRYTRGQPITEYGQLPAVSRATPQRELRLLFVVSRGVRITEFRVGDRTIERFDEPITTDRPQR